MGMLAAVVAAPVAGQVVQTDWAGGPGAAGPVEQWNDRFDLSMNAAWRSIGGQLSLASTPLFEPALTIVAGKPDYFPAGTAAGDVDGDGFDDPLVAAPIIGVPFADLGGVYWFKAEQDGTWTPHPVSEDFDGARYIDTTDMDADGDVDVIACSYWGEHPDAEPHALSPNGKYAWFENLGNGTAWEAHIVGTLFHGAVHVDGADLDADGDMDLFGVSSLTDGGLIGMDDDGNFVFKQDADVVWFENEDGAGDVWSQHTLDENYPSEGSISATDLDGDGDLDLVAGGLISFNLGAVAWWGNLDGTGDAWSKHAIMSNPSFGRGVLIDAGDLDDDGDVDGDGMAGRRSARGRCAGEPDLAGAYGRHIPDRPLVRGAGDGFPGGARVRRVRGDAAGKHRMRRGLDGHRDAPGLVARPFAHGGIRVGGVRS
jgi:hypothetical protein